MGLSRGTVSDFLLEKTVIITNLIPAGAQCTTATCCTQPGWEQINYMTSNTYLIQNNCPESKMQLPLT